MPKFVFFCATNRTNLELAKLLMGWAEETGAETEIVQLEDLNIPLFTPIVQQAGVPREAGMLNRKLIESDALILLAPEYNGSIPPVVTNAIAWMSVAGSDFRAAFNGRFAVVGSSSAGTGFKVIEAMRSQLNHLGMIVLARCFLSNSHKKQDPDSARAIFRQLIALVRKKGSNAKC